MGLFGSRASAVSWLVTCEGFTGLRVQGFRVAVKELNLRYYIGETILITIHTHYGI